MPKKMAQDVPREKRAKGPESGNDRRMASERAAGPTVERETVKLATLKPAPYNPLRLGQLQAEADAARRKFLARDDLDEAPAPPNVPVTQLGDVWTLDRHRLVCGDSTDPAAVAALLQGELVDQLVTDPPYGVDYTGSGIGDEKTHRTRIANDVGRDYRPWFASWLTNLPWADYATFFLFMGGSQLHNLRVAIGDAGLTWADYLIWVKSSMVLGRKDYNARCEFVVYGWPKRHRFFGPSNSTNVLEYARPSKSDLHPTMKPIALIERLLSDGSADGALILDLFGGSGSTLIACEASHRRARLIELDPAYCDVIVERWQALTGGKATRNGNPA